MHIPHKFGPNPWRGKPRRDRRRLRARLLGAARVKPPKPESEEYADDTEAAFDAAWEEIFKEAGP